MMIGEEGLATHQRLITAHRRTGVRQQLHTLEPKAHGSDEASARETLITEEFERQTSTS